MLILDGEHAAIALAFTPDSTELVAASADGRVELWTLATGEQAPLRGPAVPPSPPAPPRPSWMRPSWDPNLTANAFAVHPSGQAAYVGGKSAFTVVSLTDRPHRVRDASPVRAVIASPDGKWVVIQPAEGRRLLGFQCAEDGTLPVAWAWEADPQGGEETPGGFVNSCERFVTVGNQVLVVRDSATGAALFTVPQPAYSPSSRAASPDGTRFALMTMDRFYLWDTIAWGKPTAIEGNGTWPFTAFAFHPTRSLLAAVQRGQSLVKLYDCNTGKPVAKLRWEIGEMQSVCFSPDGTLAAAGGVNGKVVVWDVD